MWIPKHEGAFQAFYSYATKEEICVFRGIDVGPNLFYALNMLLKKRNVSLSSFLKLFFSSISSFFSTLFKAAFSVTPQRQHAVITTLGLYNIW